MEHFDVIVAGLGAMGSATAHQLAKRGVSVLGLDRFSPPHPKGSTHGDTRVTRLAIGEGAAYIPFVQRSHELWREIEAETGAELLTMNGVLILASGTADSLVHGKAHFLETTISGARASGIDHEVLDAAELHRRFPQFGLSGDERGYFEPGGGFVRPEAAVAAELSLARRHGAVIKVDEAVTGFRAVSGGVTVKTDSAEYSGATLVLAVGAWLGSMLEEPYAHNFVISRQLLHWYAVAGPIDPFLPDRFPVFIWDYNDRGFYGFPAVDGPEGGIKVAHETHTPRRSVDDVERAITDAERFGFYDDIISSRLPGLARECVKVLTCIYTTTPDGDFVVDRHPEHDSIVVMSPCSGHGFKHSAALGEAVAETIVDGRSRLDLSPFSFARLL